MQRTAKTGELFRPIGVDRLAVLLWLGFVAVSVATHREAITSLTFWDPDNAMRLAQVRDLAAGQGWFDTAQHRVNPAGGGGLMHWSRFIDAQIVGLMAFLSWFVEPATAERWALAFYPPLLVLPLLLVFSRILQILGDRTFVLVGLAIAASTLSFLHYFAPLNIDHHNWQLLLSVTLLWLAIRPPHFWTGFAAAFVASMYVEISLEGLPFLAFFWALFALDWLRDPARSQRLAGFSAGVILLPALWLALFRGATSPLGISCDSFSWPYLAAVALAGAVFSGCLAAPDRLTASLPRRFFVVAIAGVVGAAGFFATGPSCLAGPFAELEPLVRTHWYDLILEGRPLWEQDRAMVAIYAVPTLVGAAASIWACWQMRGRPGAENWLRAGFLIVCATILALLVTRTIGVAHAYMVPAFAALAIALWRWSRARATALGRIGSALLFLVAIPLVDIILGAMVSPPVADDGVSGVAVAGDCPTAPMLAALAKAPPTLLFSPIHIAPALLVGTPHSVVTTGHHRNHVVMNRVITAFLAPPDAARSIVRGEGAHYLALCTQQTEVTNAAAANPDGLAAHLLRGEAIVWLKLDPALSSGSFHVYRIADATPTDLN